MPATVITAANCANMQNSIQKQLEENSERLYVPWNWNFEVYMAIKPLAWTFLISIFKLELELQSFKQLTWYRLASVAMATILNKSGFMTLSLAEWILMTSSTFCMVNISNHFVFELRLLQCLANKKALRSLSNGNQIKIT